MMVEQYGAAGARRCRFHDYVAAAWFEQRVTYLEHETLRRLRCFGEVHGHELRKASQGGSRTDPENVIPCCDFHNSWIESEPELAHRLGLVKWRRDE